MNFYKRYMGDIQRVTGHLSCTEMGVYDRFLDHYYSTETPLPADIDTCCRIARAMDKTERKAVDTVLRQFFTLTDDGYVQNRAEEEIAEAQPKIAAAKANGKLGGRPRGSKNKTKEVTEEKPSGFPENNPSGTQGESSPEPEPDKTSVKVNNTQDSIGPSATMPGLVCAAIKNLKIPDVNPAHPMLLKLIEAGATIEEFINAAEQSKVKKFAYVIGVVAGQREQAAQAQVSNVSPIKQKPWHLTSSGIEAKGQELGVTQERDETFPAYKARIYKAAGLTEEEHRKACIDFKVEFHWPKALSTRKEIA
jgi:uncharacterized protein YdaU (DUF1376 family)